MKHLNLKLSLIALLSIFIIASCATTPKQSQLLTIETFNGMYKQYLDEYDKQPEEIQDKWKREVDPYWAEASQAISEYLKVSNPDSTEAEKKLAIYSAAKNHALKLLIKYGVEIKEE